MSFGIDIRNSVAIGLGGIATLASGGDSGVTPPPVTTWNALLSNGTNLPSPFTVYNAAGGSVLCPQAVYNAAGSSVIPA